MRCVSFLDCQCPWYNEPNGVHEFKCAGGGAIVQNAAVIFRVRGFGGSVFPSILFFIQKVRT